MNIIETNNYILDKLVKIQNGGGDNYIYGCGQIGHMIYKVFSDLKIKIVGFIVDDEYYTENTIYEVPIIKYSDLVLRDAKTHIVVALRDYAQSALYKDVELRSKVEVTYADVESLCSFNGSYYEYGEYVKQNYYEIEKLYNTLEDEKSKNVLEAFINQRISGKWEYLGDEKSDVQYWERDLIRFRENFHVVDCGAFDGDSYRSFLKMIGLDFCGLYWMFEPDQKSYNTLLEKHGNDKRCEIHCIGAWNEKRKMHFSGDGSWGSSILDSGIMTIDCDALDNIIGDRHVDMIKMDIEGAEQMAIKGLKSIITRDKPILAICVYHKYEDIVKVPEIILDLYEGYRLYLRAYSSFCQEIVLYALP